jgi:hypothetical protein
MVLSPSCLATPGRLGLHGWLRRRRTIFLVYSDGTLRMEPRQSSDPRSRASRVEEKTTAGRD